ncbi:SUR7 protein [Xylaria nigripes]|nr:SUR7 protein [Xylaria nigripes]
MGRVGRYFCVALPFILTVASIIAFLIVGLAGVTSNGLYLFRIDLTDVAINGSQIQGIANDIGSLFSGKSLDDINTQVHDVVGGARFAVRSPVDLHDRDLLDDVKNGLGAGLDENQITQAIDALGNTRITASELGLANIYDFTLWNYCVTPQDGKKNCTQAQFDWASHEINTTWIQKFNEATASKVTIPKEVEDGIDLYKTITKWTEVVFIIAMVALGLELLVGLFTACSRAVSCVTWIVSGFATVAVIATAVLLTVTGSTVTGVVLGAAHQYNVKASVNTSFLAILWLGVAFAIGASLFWLFSVCCCKPESRAYKRHSDAEKLISGASYAPLNENHHSGYNAYNFGAPHRGGPRSDLAYEPYTHS